MNETGTSTGDGDPTTVAAANQASGQSIFWALLAIAINSMLQPSITGYVWSNAHFENSLWPHRSSPFACALDSIIEIAGTRSTSPDQPMDDGQYIQPTNRGAITLRLVIFCLGVLPQAVKLFSMRGIPLTQAIAVIFLITSIPGMLRGVRSSRPHKHAAKLADDIRKKTSDINDVYIMTFLVGFAPQIAITALTWQRHSDKMQIALPVDLVNLLDWISIGTIMIWTFVLPVVSLAGGFRAVRPSSIFLPIICFHALAGLTMVEHTDTKVHKISFAATKYACVSLCSFILAYALYMSTSCLRPRKRKSSKKSDGSHGGLPFTQHEVAATSIENPSLKSRNKDIGTQTSPSVENSASAAADHTSSHNDRPPAEAMVQAKSTERPTVEPWQLSWLHVRGDIVIDTDNLYFVPPKTKDQACQTESKPESAAVRHHGTGSNRQPDHLHHRKLYVVMPPFRWLAWVVGTIYWEMLMLRVKPVNHDDELPENAVKIGRKTGKPQPFLKTMLLYVLWGSYKLIAAYVGLYRHSARSIGELLAIHNGDVMWIAFATSNFATAAVYYLVVFDGKDTYSPAWISILG